nr:S26 family signal peptidase [Rhodococcus sp. X156]
MRGPSMSPTLADGDVVLARLGARARPGMVVLVRWDARPEQLSVKRARTRLPDGTWHVLGDNSYGSTDSRALGPARVVGTVPVRLWPRPQRLRAGQPRG